MSSALTAYTEISISRCGWDDERMLSKKRGPHLATRPRTTIAHPFCGHHSAAAEICFNTSKGRCVNTASERRVGWSAFPSSRSEGLFLGLIGCEMAVGCW